MNGEEEFGQFMGAVVQGMALHLMELATGDEGSKGFLTRNSGDLRHLRVRDSQGTVLFQVSGKDTGELAWQLVLACLHKISIDQLKVLHKRPLKRPLEVAKRDG
jgi:hypothetical protein